MSEDTEFREDVKAMVRRNDPTPEEIRALAVDLETLADKYEAVDETL